MGSDGPLGFDDDAPTPARRTEPGEARAPARPGRDRWDAGGGGTPGRLTAGGGRYGWYVGGLGLLLVLAFTVSNFTRGDTKASGIKTGGQAPPFAAPLAVSDLEGDVNVATKAGSGDAGDVPACSLRRPDVLNVCALWEAGPVVLAFFTTQGDDCVPQLDALDAVVARHPGVEVAAVSIKGDRDDLRRIVRDRRWRFPVGYDADGILANAYGIADCPQVAFLRRGGRVQDTSVGKLVPAELEARVRRLEAVGR